MMDLKPCHSILGFARCTRNMQNRVGWINTFGNESDSAVKDGPSDIEAMENANPQASTRYGSKSFKLRSQACLNVEEYIEVCRHFYASCFLGNCASMTPTSTNPSLSQGNELTTICICLYAAAEVNATPTERLNSKRMYIVQSDDSDSVYQIHFVAQSVH